MLFVFAALSAPASSPATVLDDSIAWQVVGIEGGRFPAAARVRVSELRLLRASGGQLEPVPFQIDEREPGGRFALPDGPGASADEQPGVFDDNDLLVFSARDLGDRMPEAPGIEIRATDPVSGDTGWAYLGNDGDAPEAARDDVSYDAVEDAVHARRYALTFGHRTPISFAFVDREGRETRNLLDRLKARVTARILFGLLRFKRNEEDLTTTVLAWKDGPVRVIRRVQIGVRLGYGLTPPTIIAEDFMTGDAFEGPVAVRLPFDLRYAFGDIDVRIFLDFDDLEGYRVFTAGHDPRPLSCSAARSEVAGVRADWFGMSGPEGAFIHALRVSQTMQSVDRRLYVVADGLRPDPPETRPGSCPAIGYQLTGWGGIGRGTHEIGMVIRAFDSDPVASAPAFLASLRQPLEVGVSVAGRNVVAGR